jgi:hypothetical protein
MTRGPLGGLHISSQYVCCPCGVVHRPHPEILKSAALKKTHQGIFIAATAKDSMLDQLGTITTHGSLNTAYSNTGANEVTGGSPAFARKALTWASSSGGVKALAPTLPSFDVPASTTIPWWSGWSALTAGTFRFMALLGGQTLRPCMVETATDLTNNDIFCKGHGYTADQRVVFWPASNGAVVTGLTIGTVYWVISTGLTTDSFRVSATQGGAAVDITTDSPIGMFVQRGIPQTTVTQDVLTFGATQIDALAVL